MRTTGRLNNGTSLDYAFAIEIQDYRGLETISHGGALGGYRAGYLQFPRLKFSVIILANVDAFNAMGLCYRVAEIYLGDLMSDPPASPRPKSSGKQPASGFKPSPDQLSEYQGEYFCEDLAVTYTLALTREKLRFQHQGAPPGYLIPKDKDTFLTGNLRIQFERDPQGRITGFLLDAGRVRDLPFRKQNLD